MQIIICYYCYCCYAGTQWMSWALACSVAMCIPILLVHREAYNRLDVDMPPSSDADTDDVLVSAACRDNIIDDHVHPRTATVDADVSLVQPF